jgi:2-(1,2-epoxy-1,2-dihydrophenyl)acetyl-CoA isomerase
MSIAMVCDLRIAADTAGFNTAFTGVALSCDTGSSWTLPRLVGRSVALDLLLRPRTVKAEEALEMGLVSRVVPAADLAAEVADVATTMANGPTLAFASVKSAVTFAASHSFEESLGFESQLMARTGSSADHRGAVEAFVEKREPSYQGR